jgi:hypothetical protein
MSVLAGSKVGPARFFDSLEYAQGFRSGGRFAEDSPMQGPWQDLYSLVAGCAAQQKIHLKAFSTCPCRLANSFPLQYHDHAQTGPRTEVSLEITSDAEMLLVHLMDGALLITVTGMIRSR